MYQHLLLWGTRQIKHQCLHSSHPHLLQLLPTPTNYTSYLGFLSYFLQSHAGPVLEQQPLIFHLCKDSPSLLYILTLVQIRIHFYRQVNTTSWHKQKMYNQTKRTKGKMKQPGGQEKRKVT